MQDAIAIFAGLRGDVHAYEQHYDHAAAGADARGDDR
jgi:hypothetical protein